MNIENKDFIGERLRSLDVFRGLVMLALAARGFGLAQVANKTDCALLNFLTFHVSHPEWASQFKMIGFSCWDMIQPAFMFIVGVSMPYSYARRQQMGHSYGSRLCHVWGRATILVGLGGFLQSLYHSETNWLFTNVLSQIGLGYGFLFFLAGKRFRFQASVGAIVLVAYWAAMVVFPLDLSGGLALHFENGVSMPQKFDLWFLNLFPRAKPFEGNAYATLNFVPAMVTMLFGVMCGQLLRDTKVSQADKLKKLALGGAVCLVLAVLAGATVCPIVKKLWTPSWTLFSGAYVIWGLAILYWLIDLKRWNQWTFPFVVLGVNPIAIYFMTMTMSGWWKGNFHKHLPEFLFSSVYGSVVEASLVVVVYWLILFWMYRNRVFVRI